MRTHRPLARTVAAAGLIVALALTACSGEPPEAARQVTTAEAQLLAATRFKNFDAGTREFRTVVVVQGEELTLHGWVDYVAHTGYTAVTGDGFAPQALRWDADTIAIAEVALDGDGLPPLPIAGSGWSERPLDAAASALDATVTLIGNLGSDRPENPLLVQQTGALWLGEDEVDGTAVTVFATPPSDEVADAEVIDPEASPLRLWVDATGLLLRAQLRADAEWQDIDFVTGAGPSLEAPSLQGPGDD